MPMQKLSKNADDSLRYLYKGAVPTGPVQHAITVLNEVLMLWAAETERADKLEREIGPLRRFHQDTLNRSVAPH